MVGWLTSRWFSSNMVPVYFHRVGWRVRLKPQWVLIAVLGQLGAGGSEALRCRGAFGGKHGGATAWCHHPASNSSRGLCTQFRSCEQLFLWQFKGPRPKCWFQLCKPTRIRITSGLSFIMRHHPYATGWLICWLVIAAWNVWVLMWTESDSLSLGLPGTNSDQWLQPDRPHV